MSFSRFMFLGTASAVPRPGHRNVSAMLLQFSCGSLTLIDCGEATQHQLMRSTVRMGSIDNILLTHLHGDHCFGLFGLMHTLNMGGRKSPIRIYGPSGTDELVRTVFRLTGGWNGFEIKVTELEPNNRHTFDVVSSASEQVLASVIACPMVHRLASFGYVISEPEQARTLDGPKAIALGATGSDLGRLKSGQDVTLANGSVVESASVAFPGRKARTVAVMQDTSDASSVLPYMQGVDLLVHEATYEKSLEAQAVEYGHSTAEMAARIASKSDAGILALTHFSSRYGEDNINLLKNEAEELLDGTRTKVVLGEDFMCFSGDSLSEISSIRKPE